MEFRHNKKINVVKKKKKTIMYHDKINTEFKKFTDINLY